MSTRLYRKFLALITYTVFLLFVGFNFGKIVKFLYDLLLVFKPLWYGLTLAFVLNVPISLLEKHLFKSSDKLHRVLSIMLSILCLVILLSMLFVWVIPDFIESITYLIGQTPIIINSINDLIASMFGDSEISQYIYGINGTNNVSEVISNVFKYIVENFYSGLSNAAGLLINLITGFIIAIYLLLEKEFILERCKFVVYKIFDDKIVNKLKYIYSVSYKAFRDFITFQCLECFILASIMFVTYIIFGFPYALTIAFLTGITAMIPIFGATIACVIGAVLIGTVSLKQMVVFIIVFQVVQQIENNLIYPHVVGKNVGLPPILTIIAIIVGGSLFGLFGVLVSVPLTSVINNLFWALMDSEIPKISINKKKKVLLKHSKK